MIKPEISKRILPRVSVLIIRILDFEFVSDFEFGIWNFRPEGHYGAIGCDNNNSEPHSRL
jgi:hypothetical protein